MKREIEIEVIMDSLDKDAEIQLAEVSTWITDVHTYEGCIDPIILLRDTLTEIINYHNEYTNLNL